MARKPDYIQNRVEGGIDLSPPADICIPCSQESVANDPRCGISLRDGSDCDMLEQEVDSAFWKGFLNVTEEIRQVLKPIFEVVYAGYYEVVQEVVEWVVGLFVDKDEEEREARRKLRRAYSSALRQACEKAEEIQRAELVAWLVRKGYGPLIAFVSRPQWLTFDSVPAQRTRDYIWRGSAPGPGPEALARLDGPRRVGTSEDRRISQIVSRANFGLGAPKGGQQVAPWNLPTVLYAFLNARGRQGTISSRSPLVPQGVRYAYWNTIGPYSAYFPLTPALQTSINELLSGEYANEAREPQNRNCIEGSLRVAVGIGVHGPLGESRAGLRNIDSVFRAELAYLRSQGVGKETPPRSRRGGPLPMNFRRGPSTSALRRAAQVSAGPDAGTLALSLGVGVAAGAVALYIRGKR